MEVFGSKDDLQTRVAALERETRLLRAHVALLERLAPNAPGVNAKWADGPISYTAESPDGTPPPT